MQTADQTTGAQREPFWLELRRYWRRLPDKGLFLVLLCAWCALFQFWGTTQFNFSTTPSLFQWMYSAWNRPSMDSSHGNLVPFVIAGLLWFKRGELANCKRGPGWVGLPLLGAAVLLHIVGYLAQQPRFSMVAFLLGLYGLIAAVWGSRAMKAVFFPLVLFLFCIPVEVIVDNISLPLRLLSARATEFTADDLLSIPVLRNGTQLYNTHGDAYEVAAACSGIRSIVALLGVTTVYAVLTFKKLWKRALIISLTIPLAIVCNVLRLTAMIVTREAVSQSAALFVHEWFGYVTYGIALVCVMLAGWWLQDKKRAAPPASSSPVYGAL
jgi:exosortase